MSTSSGQNGHSVPEAAKRLGVPSRTVRRWATNGQIAAKKDKGRWVIFLPEENDHEVTEVTEVAEEMADMTGQVAVSSGHEMTVLAEEMATLNQEVASIKAFLAGQTMTEMTGHLAGMADKVAVLSGHMTDLSEENEKLREELKVERAHAARREEAQREQLGAIQEALQPWWKKIFRREKSEDE